MGLATSGEHVDWAVSELVAGADTPNLRILAGLSKPAYHADVAYHFERALNEMGISLPEPRAYLGKYARDIARAIVSGEITPLDGCSEIYSIWKALGYPDSLWRWVYLGDGFDPEVYGELEDDELDAAIVREAERLLRDLNDPL